MFLRVNTAGHLSRLSVLVCLMSAVGCQSRPLRSTYIRLDSPADHSQQCGWQGQAFTYSVVSPNVIESCRLYLDDNPHGAASTTRPRGSGSVTLATVPFGTHRWTVRCHDKEGREYRSEQARTFVSTQPEKLNACKTSGWQENGCYQLSNSIKQVEGTCFDIDQPGVILDGNGHAVVSAKLKDIVYSRQDLLWDSNGKPVWDSNICEFKKGPSHQPDRVLEHKLVNGTARWDVDNGWRPPRATSSRIPATTSATSTATETWICTPHTSGACPATCLRMTKISAKK